MKASNIQARICAVLAALATVVLAGPAQAAEQWGSAAVKFIYPFSDGSFAIALTTDPPECTAGSPKYLRVVVGQNGVTADGLKAMLAVALTAAASGKMLYVAYSDSTTNCYVNRVVLVN